MHIPFLTTWADYNQRIVVSNRGANPASYWITFRPEDGVTVLDRGEWVTQGAMHRLLWLDENGNPRAAIVKRTGNGEIYLVTYRRAWQDQIDRLPTALQRE